MTKRLLLAGVLGLVLVAAVPAPARAGGWAAVTVDAMPVVRAGVPTDIIFTIRQHGVTPVWPQGVVALAVVAPDGRTLSFGADRGEQAGRYRARVEIPTPGRYRWRIQPGWFPPQELGSLVVSNRVTTATSGYRGTPLARFALTLAALAVAELALARRRHGRPTPAEAAA
jgi:hypothetical protein